MCVDFFVITKKYQSFIHIVSHCLVGVLIKCSVLTNCDSLAGESAMKGFAKVPYIQGIAKPITRILNNCGIKVALKPLQTIGHIFAKPRDRVLTDRKTHAVVIARKNIWVRQNVSFARV